MMSSYIFSPKLLMAISLIGIALIASACLGDDSEQKITDANAAASSAQTGLGNEESRRVSVFDLRTGDCYNEPDLLAASDGETLDVYRVELVPCSTAHDFEVMKLLLVDIPDGSPYPGESYFDDLFISDCPLDTEYFLFPDSESWKFGDRVLTCLKAAPELIG